MMSKYVNTIQKVSIHLIYLSILLLSYPIYNIQSLYSTLDFFSSQQSESRKLLDSWMFMDVQMFPNPWDPCIVYDMYLQLPTNLP